jgi:hypothetical protein
MTNKDISKIEGMFLILDRRNVKGLKHWADELERRGVPAIIQVDEYMIENYGEVIKNLSDRGFDIGGIYHEKPFWGESYSFQYEKINQVKNKVESCTNKPMRIVSSKYFGYDEVTLRVADGVGVNYVIARGTTGARAVVYKAEEYNTKIVSFSNIPWKKMGSGSLCDESLWCRGATPDDFKKVLFGLKEDRITFVAQTHLSGVKLHWWNAYQDYLDKNIVTWKSLKEFAANPIVLPSARIPVNTDVTYIVPKPRIPLEKEPDYPFGEL